ETRSRLLSMYYWDYVGSLAFFFQAEDGIRDFHVTGVQTCALPILGLSLRLTGIKPATLLTIAHCKRRVMRMVVSPRKCTRGSAGNSARMANESSQLRWLAIST